MTQQFIQGNWNKKGDGYTFEIPYEFGDDKPMVQLYVVENGAALLSECSVIVTENLITLVSSIPLNGYVVIR